MVSGALETQDLGVKISKLDVNVDVNMLLLQYVAYVELPVSMVRNNQVYSPQGGERKYVHTTKAIDFYDLYVI